MRRDRRRTDHLRDVTNMVQPPARAHDERPPTWWEGGFVYLELFGFTVLFVTGMIATAWGTARYVMGAI
jgi:hypothetical protein